MSTNGLGRWGPDAMSEAPPGMDLEAGSLPDSGGLSTIGEAGEAIGVVDENGVMTFFDSDEKSVGQRSWEEMYANAGTAGQMALLDIIAPGWVLMGDMTVMAGKVQATQEEMLGDEVISESLFEDLVMETFGDDGKFFAIAELIPIGTAVLRDEIHRASDSLMGVRVAGRIMDFMGNLGDFLGMFMKSARRHAMKMAIQRSGRVRYRKEYDDSDYDSLGVATRLLHDGESILDHNWDLLAAARYADDSNYPNAITWDEFWDTSKPKYVPGFDYSKDY